MGSITETVCTRIGSLRKQALRPFVEISGIPELFDDGQVAAILKEHKAEPHYIIRYSNVIQTEAPRIFAALIWLKQPLCIITFVENQLYDGKLPYETRTLQPFVDANQLSEQFLETQYEYVPHKFRGGLHAIIRDEKVVLPFASVVELSDKDGSFGSISRVSISPTFRDFVNMSPTQTYIRKEVRLGRGPKRIGGFHTEKKNLELLHCIKHPNIVELLCSYTIFENGNEKHFLIFPEEPMDLSEFFKCEEAPGQFSQPETFYFALQDLASALHKIHEFNLDESTHSVDYKRIGSHRDLRPNNILVRHDTMVIADFGLADFKNLGDPKGSQTEWKAGRGDYIAPECYGPNFTRLIVGRSLDIWAFGCMIIDIATYMEEGAAALNDFQSARVSPWVPHVENGFFFRENSVKSEVLKKITNLSQQSGDLACSALMNAARRMLVVSPDARPSSSEVWVFMQHACFVKLCHQTSAELAEYEGMLKRRDDIGFSQVTLWFEMERLKSWTKALGAAEPSTWPSFNSIAASISLNDTQTSLRDTRGLVSAQHSKMASSLKLDDNGEQSASLHHVFQKRLSEHVQKLFEALPMRIQKRADNWWTQRLLDTSAEKELTILSSESLGSENRLFRELGQRALVKQFVLAVSEDLQTTTDESQLLLQSSRVSGYYSNGTRRYAFYEGDSEPIPVLVESYTIQEKEDEPQSVEEAKLRKVNLARLLAMPAKPPSFHVLDCIGFTDSSSDGNPVSSSKGSGAKFLYRIPSGCLSPNGAFSHIHMPQDLHWLMVKKDYTVPSLEQRITLAQVLVTSIHSLHLNGWLHKSLSSSNILLFPNLSGAFDLASPRIVGFTHSRPDGSIWSSSGYAQPSGSLLPLAYIHPNYTDQIPGQAAPRFLRVYDYYSAGIILLELGLWRSHITMLKSLSDDNVQTRDRLFMDYIPRLRVYMGSAYTKAVTKCLQIDFQEEEPGASAEHQLNEFYSDVVEPISEMRV